MFKVKMKVNAVLFPACLETVVYIVQYFYRTTNKFGIFTETSNFHEYLAGPVKEKRVFGMSALC